MGWALGWTGGCPVSGCLGGWTDCGFAPTVSGNFKGVTIATAWFTTGCDFAIGTVNGPASWIVGRWWIVGGAELLFGGCGKADWRVCKAAPSG